MGKVNLPRIHSSPQCVCTKQPRWHLWETKTDRTERGNGQQTHGHLFCQLLRRTSHPPQQLTKQVDRKSRTDDLNSTINQQALTDIYKALHSTAAEYTFFSSTHRTYTMQDSGHKASLNKCKSIQVMQSKFSDHNGVKLEISNTIFGNKTSYHLLALCLGHGLSIDFNPPSSLFK